MTSDQLGDLMNFFILAVPFLYRIFVSGRRNTPKATEVRLTNGHANGTAKRDTDEVRLYRERELMADRLRDEQAADFLRWRTFHEQRYFEDKAREEARWRSMEDSIKHFEEFSRLMVVRVQQLDDCCAERRAKTQETTVARAKPLHPPETDIPAPPGGLEAVA